MSYQKPGVLSKHYDELFVGIACAVIGMGLFNLGIALGLTPLGEQLGGNELGLKNYNAL